jgi:hypothetical protein
MDGTLEPDDTPGGGLTMIITLPAYLEDTADPTLASHVDAARERRNR